MDKLIFKCLNSYLAYSGDKKIWSLNPIEKIAYNELIQVFAGDYMVKDLSDINNDDKFFIICILLPFFPGVGNNFIELGLFFQLICKKL